MKITRVRMSPALRQAISENLRRGHDERELERKRTMNLLLLLIILLVLFGGGGGVYYGSANGWGYPQYGGLGLVLLVLLLVLLLAGRR